MFLTTTQAMAMTKQVGLSVSLATLIKWIERKSLGFQPGGVGSRWYIYKKPFEEFISQFKDEDNEKD